MTLEKILADPLFKKNRPTEEDMNVNAGVKIGFMSKRRDDSTTLTIQTIVKGDTIKPVRISVWVKKSSENSFDPFNADYGKQVLELTNPSDKQSDKPIGYSNINFFDLKEK